MYRCFGRLFCFTLTAAWTSLGGGAFAQVPPLHDVEFFVAQTPDATGGFDYSLSVSHRVSRMNTFAGILTSPNGSEFLSDSDAELQFGDFPEFSAFVFGEWKANEVIDGSPLEYSFDVAPFALGVFALPPVIVSPQNDSTVHLTFPFAFEYPNGHRPNGQRFDLVGSENVADTDVHNARLQNGRIVVDYTVELEGPGPGMIELQVAGDSKLGINKITPAPVAGEEFTYSFEFRSWSEVTRLTVVPEPASWLLLGLAAGGILGTRRR